MKFLKWIWNFESVQYAPFFVLTVTVFVCFGMLFEWGVDTLFGVNVEPAPYGKTVTDDQ
jgi:hypothetical protein